MYTIKEQELITLLTKAKLYDVIKDILLKATCYQEVFTEIQNISLDEWEEIELPKLLKSYWL